MLDVGDILSLHMETIPLYWLMNPLIIWTIFALQIVSVALLLGLLNVSPFSKLVAFVGRQAISLSFVVLFAAVVGSLYYSEIAGFPACTLCWIQRIFIYPQVIIFGLAQWYRRRDVFLYTSTLSILGLGVALYNVFIQTFNTVSAFCEPGSAASSCLEKYVEGLGYITIPVMSVTLLTFLLLVMWAEKKTRHMSVVA